MLIDEYLGFLSSLIWLAISMMLMNFFIIENNFASIGISIVFSIIYSIYILIDTQLILGRGENKISLDDYILGATILYIDIIGLFLRLLRLLGERADN
jgi:hypothetical protein